MSVQLTYKTKQRDLLLEYLEANPETHITVSDVCDYFKSKDVAIGQTTIYRHLERMVDEIGIDRTHDFYNDSHLNIYGQQKLTSFLSEYMIANCDLVQRELTQAQKAEWDLSAEYYDVFCRYLEERIPAGSDREITETAALIRTLDEMRVSKDKGEL